MIVNFAPGDVGNGKAKIISGFIAYKHPVIDWIRTEAYTQLFQESYPATFDYLDVNCIGIIATSIVSQH